MAPLLIVQLYQLPHGVANIAVAGPDGRLCLVFGPQSIYSLGQGGISMIRLKSSGSMMICLLLAAAFFPLSADTNAGTDSGDAGDQRAVEADPI